MNLVVIGGSGLIGSKLVTKLRDHGHDAVPASPNTGVNTLTGEGLADALQGAAVVVDVSNSPSFEDAAVLEFFETSTRNLLDAEAAVGVGHHAALSIVGNDRLPDSGYMRAKVAQEKLIRGSSIPYSIVHATQFFEFIGRIADDATDGDTVRLPPVLFQPIAADDVAAAVGRVAVGEPLNGVVEVAGPEQFRFDDFIRRGLAARHDPRQVVGDPARALLRDDPRRAQPRPRRRCPARRDEVRRLAHAAGSDRDVSSADHAIPEPNPRRSTMLSMELRRRPAVVAAAHGQSSSRCGMRAAGGVELSGSPTAGSTAGSRKWLTNHAVLTRRRSSYLAALPEGMIKPGSHGVPSGSPIRV